MRQSAVLFGPALPNVLKPTDAHYVVAGVSPRLHLFDERQSQYGPTLSNRVSRVATIGSVIVAYNSGQNYYSSEALQTLPALCDIAVSVG